MTHTRSAFLFVCAMVVVAERTPARANSPVFVTYAVASVGRWKHAVIKNALKIMYSSIARSYIDEGPPLLYVYSDTSPEKLHPATTTFGTPTRITFRRFDMGLLKKHPRYTNPWKQLSRSKLDTIMQHVRTGEKAVWIDLDTLVLDKLPLNVPWVVGWQHGKARLANELKDYNISFRNDAHGDLWFVDDSIAQAVEFTEQRLKKLPLYDLQGIFSILLEKNSTRLAVLQDSWPRAVGFECLGKMHGKQHPHIQNLFLRPANGIDANHPGINCTTSWGADLRVGMLSFTAPTFLAIFQLGSASPKVHAKNMTKKALDAWLFDLPVN